MTPQEHDERAAELVDRAVAEIPFNLAEAELYLKAAEIHAKLACPARGRPNEEKV